MSKPKWLFEGGTHEERASFLSGHGLPYKPSEGKGFKGISILELKPPDPDTEIWIDWLTKIDLRVMWLIRDLTYEERRQLIGIEAEEGSCWLRWEGGIPKRFCTDESVPRRSWEGFCLYELRDDRGHVADQWWIESFDYDGRAVEEMDRAYARIQRREESSEERHKREYRDYLQGDHWKTVKRMATEHYGGVCCLCGSKKQLNVHHRTYERRGHERLADVILLCDKCHTKFHEP